MISSSPSLFTVYGRFPMARTDSRSDWRSSKSGFYTRSWRPTACTVSPHSHLRDHWHGMAWLGIHSICAARKVTLGRSPPCYLAPGENLISSSLAMCLTPRHNWMQIEGVRATHVLKNYRTCSDWKIGARKHCLENTLKRTSFLVPSILFQHFYSCFEALQEAVKFQTKKKL